MWDGRQDGRGKQWKLSGTGGEGSIAWPYRSGGNLINHGCGLSLVAAGEQIMVCKRHQAQVIGIEGPVTFMTVVSKTNPGA